MTIDDPRTSALACLSVARKQIDQSGLGPRPLVEALTALGQAYATVALADAVAAAGEGAFPPAFSPGYRVPPQAPGDTR